MGMKWDIAREIYDRCLKPRSWYVSWDVSRRIESPVSKISHILGFVFVGNNSDNDTGHISQKLSSKMLPLLYVCVISSCLRFYNKVHWLVFENRCNGDTENQKYTWIELGRDLWMCVQTVGSGCYKFSMFVFDSCDLILRKDSKERLNFIVAS